jgi:hypothetical protein
MRDRLPRRHRRRPKSRSIPDDHLVCWTPIRSVAAEVLIRQKENAIARSHAQRRRRRVRGRTTWPCSPTNAFTVTAELM